MLTPEHEAICECFVINGCDNGWTACPINSLKKALTQMAPYRARPLMDENDRPVKEKFMSALKYMVKKGYVKRRMIKDKWHYTLDKEAFYPF